jgi:hypothetical protein
MAQLEDLHPYDGQTRTFGHDDKDPSQRARGLALVVKVLRLQAPPPVAGLRYHLSFHSGGTGIFDRLHIALPRTPAEVEAIVARLQLVTPEVAAVDAEWHEQFENLVLDEDEPRPLRAAVMLFSRRIGVRSCRGRRRTRACGSRRTAGSTRCHWCTSRAGSSASCLSIKAD